MCVAGHVCVRAAYSELYGQSFGRRRRRRSGDMVPSLLDLQSDTDASRRDTEVRCTDRHKVKKRREPSPPYALQIHGSVPDIGWRRGSVVRTSVFDRQTFPDLRLIYG